MGRRAWTTGELVRPKHSWAGALWRTPNDNLDSSDIVVTDFELGTIVGMQEVEWKPGRRVMKFLIFDSRTQKFGWCEKKYLKRVDK